jgi:hypothetical protein
VLEFISRGVFIGVPGAVINLIKSVTRQVLAGRPSRAASTEFLHDLGLPVLMSTRVLEATCQTDIKFGRLVRGFGWPATPWAH